MSRPSLIELLETLPGEDGAFSLRELLDKGGPEHIYGLGVTLLAATAFIPGVTNVLALGIIGLGAQMAAGRAYPWLPARLLRLRLHPGRLKAILTKAARFLERLSPRSVRRPVPRRALGLLITWTALLLALPLPLPFSNLLPGAALLFMGLALLEDWPFPAWIGLAGSLATIVYFAFSFDLVMKALRAASHLRHLTD
ncbi:MAG: exopolysaccharide biosynthesis protein [Acidobacteria bacterium]|nr:exopolysaccharide biosynthesis protein [Acidobacteriota bacterium]